MNDGLFLPQVPLKACSPDSD